MNRPPQRKPLWHLLAGLCVVLLVVGIGFSGAAIGTADTAEPANQTPTWITVEETEQIEQRHNSTVGWAARLGNTTEDDTVEIVVRLDDRLSEQDDLQFDLQEHKSERVKSQASVVSFADTHDGITVLKQLWLANAVVLEIDTDHVSPEQIDSIDGVTQVHPNFNVTHHRSVSSSTSTPAVGHELHTSLSEETTYGIELINATSVWDRYDTRGAGARIAVLDTGVDEAHPDIELTGWAEFDTQGHSIDSEPNDPDGHGTHVTGTVGGQNTSGTAIGVAPEADLYHAKVFDDSGDATFASVVAGMEWSVENNVSMISMSLGAAGYVSPFIEPVEDAQAAGTAVIAGSGNSGDGVTLSPGNLYSTYSVGAVREDSTVASFSSGERIVTAERWDSSVHDSWPETYIVPDSSAPGVETFSALPGGEYGQKSGTSMATPHVAGAVALVQSATGATADEALTSLTSTAHKPVETDATFDTRYGAGIIDVYQAISQHDSQMTITGTVVDRSENPLEGITVASEYRVSTQTDHNGEFELVVPSSEQTIRAGPRGELREQRVRASDQTGEMEFVLSSHSPDVVVTSEPEEYINPSETRSTLSLDVLNADTLRITNGDGHTIDNESMTVRVDGEPVSLDSAVDLSTTDIPQAFDVEVAFDSGTVGVANLSLEIHGTDGTETVSMGPTTVHPDPVRIPEHTEPNSLEWLTSFVVPDTVIELGNVTVEQETTDREGVDAGMVINNSVTIRAASNATPTIYTESRHADAAGITVRQNASMQGVSLRGNTTIGVLTSESTADFSNLTITESDTGIVFSGATGSVTETRVIDATTGIVLNDGAANVSLSDITINSSATAVRFNGAGEHNQIDQLSSNASTTISIENSSTVSAENIDSGPLWYDLVGTDIAVGPAETPSGLQDGYQGFGSLQVTAAGEAFFGEIAVNQVENGATDTATLWHFSEDGWSNTTFERSSAPGETPLTGEVTQDGIYTLVDGDESDPWNEYLHSIADEEGKIQAQGLRTAFTDWQRSELTSRQLREVFLLWQRGEPI